MASIRPHHEPPAWTVEEKEHTMTETTIADTDLAAFRELLPVIDPAALTNADRRALIALVKESVPPDPVS